MLNSKTTAEYSLKGIGRGLMEMQVTSQNSPGVAKNAVKNHVRESCRIHVYVV